MFEHSSKTAQRLKHLNESQLKLLADGSSNDILAMSWIAVLKRIKLTTELTRDLLLEKLEGSDPVLRRSDMTDFYKSKEKQHPELKALSYSSHKKIQSTLLSMLREMGLLAENQIKYEFATRALSRMYKGISTSITGKTR